VGARPVPDLGPVTHLLYQFTLRDLKARYKQTFLGPVWVVARPVVELGVYVVVFGVFLRAPSDGVPYGLFAYSGIVVWTFVAGSLSRGVRSITAHAGLVSQSPLPSVVIPLSVMAGAAIDALLAALLLAVWLAARGALPGLGLLAIVPTAIVLAAIVGGLTLIVAALSVFYRDVAHLVDAGVRIWFLVTPVAYAPSIVPAAYRAWYALNPLVPLFSAMRRAVFGGATPTLAELSYPAMVGAGLLLAGTLVFWATRPWFAESV
jgi:lipopolysaccharide transport system permease protein